MKVARTIADLDGDEAITPPSVAEALRYRPAASPEVESGSELGSGHITEVQRV
jgi:hypothetical protein